MMVTYFRQLSHLIIGTKKRGPMACAYLSLSWSTYSYRPKQASKKAQRLAERIVTLSWEHPRYGYRRIRALLVKEGWTASRKFVQAVRRSSGLQVKPPKSVDTVKESLQGRLLKQPVAITFGPGTLSMIAQTMAVH